MNVTFNIPQGYEFDRIDPSTSSGGTQITVILKKQQTKNFNYFVDEYLTDFSGSTCDVITNWISDNDLSIARNNLKDRKFNMVPWEIKIGLFRFICNEMKMLWWREFIRWESGYISDVFKELLDQSFIDDLCNEKHK